MANKIKVKLILELRSAGLSQTKIADTRHMSRHSVSDVDRIAKEKGITFNDVRDLSEDEVYKLFFPDKFAVETMFEDPDYDHVHEELKKTGVTLKLLWEEYRDRCKAENLISMGYTKFCADYGVYTVENKLTNHLDNKPGEKIEVDWSGSTMSYIDYSTGEIVTVYLFVATLPYSQYSYVYGTTDMKMDTFIRCHIRMYEFFGGVATRLVCDNLKAAVTSHPREGEIVLTSDYEAMGMHYVTAIMPAGVRKPKQKASVEGTCGKIATAIIAKLRNQTFTSLHEVNTAITRALYEFNNKDFTKREGSRYEAYLDEKPYLHPLPSVPYEIATWVYGRKVNLDFHVVFEKNRYSCPYQYTKKSVDLRITDTKVEIYSGSERIATHTRFAKNRKNQYSTHPEDMPDRFRITPWDDERIKRWAASIGKSTAQVIDTVFAAVQIKEQGYNPALSILKLSTRYSEARLETACEYAIANGIRRPRYHHLNSILSANQDILYLEKKKSEEKPADAKRGYVRGSSYYGGGGNS